MSAEQACYRYGRCDDDHPREDRLRIQRMDRLAPQPPTPVPYAPLVRRNVEATPEAEVQPGYREAGSVREEFKHSGEALKTGEEPPKTE